MVLACLPAWSLKGVAVRVAVIGAGNVGAAFSRAAVSAGHAVSLTAADPDHATATAMSLPE